MNRPPETEFQKDQKAKAQVHRAAQLVKMKAKWQALREVCSAHHLDGSPGTNRGRVCACGKGMGHGDACEMLAILRNFFLNVNVSAPRSWEVEFINLVREAIP